MSQAKSKDQVSRDHSPGKAARGRSQDAERQGEGYRVQASLVTNERHKKTGLQISYEKLICPSLARRPELTTHVRVLCRARFT